MASHFVVRELYEQTVAQMETLGSELTHKWGAAAVGRHGLPNQYTWVPTKTRDAKRLTLRGGDKDRALYDIEEAFEVHCWAESHEVAILMRDNLIHAMCLAIGSRAPLRFDECDWLLEDEDETTNGTVLMARFAVASVIPDRWTPLGRYVRQAPQSPTPQTVPTVQPTEVEIRTYSSPDVGTDGELGATDTVAE